MFRIQGRAGLEPDPKVAIELMDVACDNGSSVACKQAYSYHAHGQFEANP